MRPQRNNYRNNDRDNEINNIISKIEKVNMLKDITTKEYADEGGYADKVAKSSRQLKTNQLRKFFGAVKKFEQKDTWDDIEPEFYLLKPQLASAVGRKNIPKPFYKFIMICMRKVDQGSEEDKLENIKVFVKFFESVVAYHKYYFG
jgi:CRISPR-associated protein Csm2